MKKILILANIVVLGIFMTGCPSTDKLKKEAAAQQKKQEIQQRSDKNFEDMEKQLSK